jgi:PAS domain S-box-containing protein
MSKSSNVTERPIAEQSLRESEEAFRLLVTTVSDYAIFMLDPDGFVVSWNEGAKRLKGYEREEIVGKHFSVFYPQKDIDAAKPEKELEAVVKDGRLEDEDWRVRKDGSLFWANVVITALRDESGTLVGFAKVTRDLTERKHAEIRAVEDARRVSIAEASNRAKTDFLAAMSHELRTPLNAIGGYAELIELGIAGPLSDQLREYLKRIRSSQQHLLAIISDLLNYSRIEAGQVAYDIERIDLRTVGDRVVDMIAPQASRRHIELAWERGPGEVPAQCDRLKTEQIVLNLLSNAVKFTPAEGRVTVACSLSGTDSRITVSDTGPGIPPDRLTDIFEPFVQLGRSLSTTREGTGLGLAISRDLARAMNGEIVVESVVGEGSRFTLSLPSV